MFAFLHTQSFISSFQILQNFEISMFHLILRNRFGL